MIHDNKHFNDIILLEFVIVKILLFSQNVGASCSSLYTKSLLSKQKENGDTEFATGYFNSTATIIGFNKYLLDKSFQEVLHKLDDWINK